MDLNCSQYPSNDGYYWRHRGRYGGGIDTRDTFSLPFANLKERCPVDISLHGTYRSSRVLPCRISFFQASPDSNTVQNETSSSIYYNPATTCLAEDKKVLLTTSQFLATWPDECVVLRERCYSVQWHSKSFFPSMCNNRIHTLPPGTTHWSVDCTQDFNRSVSNAKMFLIIAGLVNVVGLLGLIFFCRFCYKQVRHSARTLNEIYRDHGSNLREDQKHQWTLCAIIFCGYQLVLSKPMQNVEHEEQKGLTSCNDEQGQQDDHFATSTTTSNRRGGARSQQVELPSIA